MLKPSQIIQRIAIRSIRIMRKSQYIYTRCNFGHHGIISKILNQSLVMPANVNGGNLKPQAGAVSSFKSRISITFVLLRLLYYVDGRRYFWPSVYKHVFQAAARQAFVSGRSSTRLCVCALSLRWPLFCTQVGVLPLYTDL